MLRLLSITRFRQNYEPFIRHATATFLRLDSQLNPGVVEGHLPNTKVKAQPSRIQLLRIDNHKLVFSPPCL